MTAEETLAKIAREVSVCTKCDLHRSRKKAVPGEGLVQAEIMFIGEGPGFHENEQGRPFVGASGKFLDELLSQPDATPLLDGTWRSQSGHPLFAFAHGSARSWRF